MAETLWFVEQLRRAFKGRMMNINVVTMPGGKALSTQEVSDTVFGAPFNEPLIHQVVTAVLAGARAGTHAQKTRTQVRGGGIKPWKQKGSGRARAGSIRSPLWRGGGKIFAAVPANYSQKVNKKMYRGALRSILSELIRQERLVVVADLDADTPKTADLVKRLKDFGQDKVLLISGEVSENLFLASRNLIKVDVLDVEAIDPVSLVGFDKIVVSVSAIKHLQERLA